MKNVLFLLLLTFAFFANAADSIRSADATSSYDRNNKSSTTGTQLGDKRYLDVVTHPSLEGNVATGKTPISVIGLNGSNAAASEDAWEKTGAYVFPTWAGQQMEIVSTSADDSYVSGLGIRTLQIDYITSAYLAASEVINVDGVTPNNTVATNIARVNDIYAVTTGSYVASAGALSLRNTAGTVTYAYLSLGQTKAKHGIYTVPDGKNLYIHSWSASGAAIATGEKVELKATADNDNVLTEGIFFTKDVVALEDGGIKKEFKVPLVIPEHADVKISCIALSGTGATCVGGFEGWLEAN